MTGAGVRKPRWTAVRAGVVSGLVVGLAFVGLTYLWVVKAIPNPKYQVDVSVIGADVTRHGGRKVLIVNAYGWAFVQVCNEACDNLRLLSRTSDNSYRVEVRDAAGACVACEPGSYVTGGYGSSTRRWRVAGKDALNVNSTYGSRP